MTTGGPISGLDPEPSLWPVLVTGGSGFVGGHVARLLAAAGHFVRGLTRRPPRVEEGDPPIDWIVGDLRDQAVRRRALDGVRGVIHTASWVSLGPDRHGVSHATNVEATGQLLAESAEAGAERFVYTSTLYSLAAGTPEQPADEFSAWNLERFDSAYMRTKRQAEQLVLAANRSAIFDDRALPGDGPGTARYQTDFDQDRQGLCPHARGDCPAGRHSDYRRRTCWRWPIGGRLVCGNGGERYAVVGPYLSYGDLAATVASLTGRPRWLNTCIPDRLEPLVVAAAGWSGPAAQVLVARRLAAARRRRVPPAARPRRSCQRLLWPRAPAGGRLDCPKLVEARRSWQSGPSPAFLGCACRVGSCYHGL